MSRKKRFLPLYNLRIEHLFQLAPPPIWLDFLRYKYGDDVFMGTLLNYAKGWLICEGGTRGGVVIKDAEKIEASPPEYTVETLIPAQSYGFLTGPPGSWKTFLALEIAFCTVNGFPVLGKFSTQKGKILYLVGEGQNGLKLRLAALQEYHGGTLEGLKVIDSWFPLVDAAWEIAATLKNLGPFSLVIIDTLNRFFQGDENSAGDASVFEQSLAPIREVTGAGVLVLHHPTKGGKGLRGSGAFEGSADYCLALEKRNGSAILTCEKAKEEETFKPINLRLKPQSTRIPDPKNRACQIVKPVIVLDDHPGIKEPGATTVAGIVLDRIRTLWKGEVLDDSDGGELRAGLKRPNGKPVTKENWRDATKALVKYGHITKVDGEGVNLLSPVPELPQSHHEIE